jgi:hypothetical protein
MKNCRAKCGWALFGLAVAVGLPLLGRWARSDGAERCAEDGLPIAALYRVRVVDSAGQSRQFCCVGCAEKWRRQHENSARSIWVTDEASGDEIEASTAWFVRSAVTTNSVTRNRIHAFRDRQDAERHAAAFAGEILDGAARSCQCAPP